jgi:hypothetical protein
MVDPESSLAVILRHEGSLLASILEEHRQERCFVPQDDGILRMLTLAVSLQHIFVYVMSRNEAWPSFTVAGDVFGSLG